MNLIGQAISHKTFGFGVVTDFTDSTITVCFPDSEKKFIFPDAFKSYLLMKDKNLQQHIQTLIAQKDAQSDRQRIMAQSELERRRKLLSFAVTPNSHAVFNVAPEEAEQVCQAFTVFTGRYLSGHSKGQPKILDRLKPNSACLLTARPAGASEQERIILGAFMVQEDFFGEDAHDGLIEGHTDYRLLLPAESPLLFWEQMGQDAPHRWGSTTFKYCSVAAMHHVLYQMVQQFDQSDAQEPALAFYHYFCTINRLRPLASCTEAVS